MCQGCERKGTLAELAALLGIENERRSRLDDRIAAAYDYADERGELLFQTVRLYSPKDFRQRRRGSDGWVWDLKGVRRVIYRLPDLLSAPTEQALFVVEGEKDADRLWAEGLPATTNPMGAGKWRDEYSESLRGRNVIILSDNDDPGRAHAQQVAQSLHRVAASVRILELPGLSEKGDVSDWLDAGGTAQELLRVAHDVDEWVAPDAKPEPARIVITDEFMHDISKQAWAALLSAGDHRYFRHGRHVARIEHDDRDRVCIAHLSTPAMKGLLDRCAEWYRITRDGEKPARPPKDVVEDMLALPQELPVLAGITGTPVFSSDGRLETTPGYQASSRLYYEPVGNPIPAVPMRPDATDLKRAKAIIGQEWLADFPFVEDASRAHALAIPITVMAREMITGPTPLFAIDAPAPGSGKGLLADGIGTIVSGRSPAVMTETRGEEERKRITALVMAGHPLILLDNVKRRLESAALAAVLTANYWSDRILGRTEEVDLPVRAVWMATGNNIQLDNDIARRTVWIRLDARVDRPWERTGFREENLGAWVQRHRHDLVWAFLVLVQNWIAAGRPAWMGKTLGSYESWSSVVGGILSAAGISGFLENREELYSRADAETEEWRAFTRRWMSDHGSAAVKSSDLLGAAQDLLPSVFEHAKDNASERSLLTRLGRALGQRRDRAFADLFIRRAGEDAHDKAALWRVETCGTLGPAKDQPSAHLPQDNQSTPDSFAEGADVADVVLGVNALSWLEETQRSENDGTSNNVPHVPQHPQSDSDQAVLAADVVRKVGSATTNVPQCKRCGGVPEKPSSNLCDRCGGEALRRVMKGQV